MAKRGVGKMDCARCVSKMRGRAHVLRLKVIRVAERLASWLLLQVSSFHVRDIYSLWGCVILRSRSWRI